MPDQAPAISHGEIAEVHDTSSPDAVAPLQETHAYRSTDPQQEVERLDTFLAEHFPEELTRTNVQQPESTVDIAIRLLTALAAKVPPSQQERCTDQYCNKPFGHRDIHGWVHSQ